MASPPSIPVQDRSERQPRSLLLVTGAPGCGKSTLAKALAELLPFALISKDALKESLYDALPPPTGDPLEHSRLLSFAAMRLLWTVAAGCPQVILEANFRPRSEDERERIASLPGRKLELYCYCSPKEAAHRFAVRAARYRHHPAHALQAISAEMLAEYDRPIGVCPVIEIATDKPVKISDVLAAIRQHWPDV